MAEVVKTQGPQPRTVACAEEPPSNSAAVEPLADLVAEDRAVWAAIVSDLLEPAQTFAFWHVVVKLHFDGFPYLADGPLSVFFEAAGFHP